MKRARVLVAGAGPAGLAAAVVAAERGAEPVVFERRRGLLDKACGEGIMPRGVAWLREHGVRLEGAGRAFYGIRYIEGERRMSGRFFGAPGVAIRRLVLSERLLERAEALKIPIEWGVAVNDVGASRDGGWFDVSGVRVEGDYGVLADGLQGVLRTKLLGDTQKQKRRPRYGLRMHVAVPPWSDHVEVHWSDHGEAYVTPVGDSEIGVAILTSQRPARWQDLLGSFPALNSRLEGQPTTSSLRGAGPLRRDVAVRRVGRIGVIGDAAGYLDACTGEGLTLAFQSAEAWIKCALSGYPDRYPGVHRRILRRYWLGTSAILLLARHPSLRRGVFELLSRVPGGFRLALASFGP
ncbi:MAG: FAD-dependent monooxygenase [Myxococcota bacterium]